ncbi:multiple epidermal growth factor-like domains 10 [Elysia marginata]|uniref:Multiple epidermal growth factor-like domains 10 n=1 Tax=Elysia marginata TaxID=1093978 RepID=A0AAV4G4L4_9GAST|nr:multiple epidermal growth factor-like domains 10 [Elysia marginata]
MCTTACVNNTYGAGCKQNCSVNCAAADKTCNNTNGHCILGCVAGFKGNFCDQTCSNVTYGPNCSKDCSVHCAGLNNTCGSVNGTCDLGCEPGYRGLKCDRGKTTTTKKKKIKISKY